MYVCTCVCIHVHVCHVYIVCHEYIDTCTCLFVVHLDIILLVVSDIDDSTKGWKSLFEPENPGVIKVHELDKVFVHSENHSLVPPNRPTFLRPSEEKPSLLFWREKKSWLRNKGRRLVPPRGDTTGMERERELRERDGSISVPRTISGNQGNANRWQKPPDPINYACSLTGKYISGKNFTDRSVQIFKSLFRRFCSP